MDAKDDLESNQSMNVNNSPETNTGSRKESICESCKEKGNTKTGDRHCKDCGQQLCDDCFRDHYHSVKTNNVSKVKYSSETVASKNTTAKTASLCDTCENESATKYCETCKTHLCKTCAQFHLRQKKTSLHNIMDESKESTDVSTICNSCKENDEVQPAVAFCKECNDFLCQKCSEFHQRQKITRSHSLCDPSQASTGSFQACNNCEENGDVQTALKFCEQCKDFLCKTCSEFHQRQKITRSHILVDADSAKLPSQSCDNCEESAIQFCKDCENFLCKSCSTYHSRQKFTKSHILIAACEANTGMSKTCDICNEDNQPAIKFCTECKSFLCNTCCDYHGRQKLTRSHVLVAVGDAPSDSNNVCDICQDNDDIQTAQKFCKECRQFLCDDCSKYHKKQKITKSHILVDAFDAPSKENYICDICNENNDVRPAPTYCEECRSFLCKECSKYHERQKITRLHKLVDAATVPKREIRECDVCKQTGENFPAKSFCHDCNSFLCLACAAYHKRQNITRSHKLVDASEIQTDFQLLCTPCKDNDENKPAFKFCKECESFLCTTCSEYHQRQKITKNHELIDPQEAQDTEENFKHCEICTTRGKKSRAEYFCKSCPISEVMCDSCAKNHTAMKMNKTHEISNDLHSLVTEGNDTLDKLATVKVEEGVSAMTLADSQNPVDKKSRAPGAVTSKNITADALDLYWDSVRDESTVSYYQIRVKDVDNDTRWKLLPTEFAAAPANVLNLKSNTKYIFQVRAVYGDDEGPFSPASDEIFTQQSPATRIVQHSVRVQEGEPAVFALPLTEYRPARNAKAKTRKFEVGPPPLQNIAEKTIMLVGATGTGKSTLVDGIVNYILGVKWNDPFRFTIEHLEEEEAQRKGNQALSQTEWITCYTINPELGSRLDYKLTIIDTPGFGDTRGLERDDETVSQIRELFSAPGKKGVVFIDAVCFLIKAPDARLTAVQTYIFNAILSLYGNDVADNIMTLVTFADGKEPPVLASLKEANLPFGTHFTFNNSGLFASNKNVDSFSLSPMFWDMGVKSFREFFLDLGRMKSVSLQLTKEVLDERQKLELTIQNLQPQVDAGLAKLNALKKEVDLFAQHQVDIKSNKNFEYEVDEVKQVMKELNPGIHTTNCLVCNYTCHPSCGYADDSEKALCIAMDKDGNCKQCPKRCYWNQHKNTKYIFEYVDVKVKRTSGEMKKKYEAATGQMLTCEQLLGKMYEDFEDLQDGIECLMCIVNQSSNRLKDIALRPNPLNMVEHIDLMVESEKLEKKAGYMERIKSLMEYRRKATITTHVNELNQEANEIMKGKKKKEGMSVSGVLSKIKKFFM